MSLESQPRGSNDPGGSPADAPSADGAPDGGASDDGAELAYTAAYAHAYATAQATLQGRSFGDAHAFGAPELPDVPGAEPAPEIETETETDTTPVADPADAPGRRRVLLVAAAVLGIVVLVAAGLLWWPRSQEPATSPSRQVALPAGVSVPTEGSYQRVQVLADEDLQVDQWIRSRSGLTAVRLSVPDVAGLDSGAVTASGIRVTRDGRIASGPARVDASQPADYRLAGATQVHLSYRLSGAVERTGSSGRALARVLGLTVSATPQRGAGVVSVQGAKVLSLACSAAQPRAVPQPCGAPKGRGWQVTLPATQRTDRVLASLDLR